MAGRFPLEAARPGGWIVKLTCCGRDDGTWAMPTWAEADKFREDYLSGPGVGDWRKPWAGGHIRSAIIVAGFEPEEVAS
jgi:hypothetical protein